MMIIPSDRMILEMTRARRDVHPIILRPSARPIEAMRMRIGHGLILAGRAIAGERPSAPSPRASARSA